MDHRLQKKIHLQAKSLKNEPYLNVYLRFWSRCHIIMNQLQAYVIKITFQNTNTEDLKKNAIKILE